MFQFAGKTALITGASSGIGRAFAEALASRGMRLILVSQQESALLGVAKDLRARYGAQVSTIPKDLSRESAVNEIALTAKQLGWQVDLLINNAGFATHGEFAALSAQREHEEIMVNVAALVDLTRVFLPGMLDRREGAVINLASTAAFQPVPYMAVYAATKAFVASFSLALQEECRGRNVRVLALCPGPTATDFFDGIGKEAAVGRKRTPEQVVATAVRALENHRGLAVDGFKNQVFATIARYLPLWLSTRLAGITIRPQSVPR